ncbi:MAG: hypothetical protein ABR507_02285 [Actinomycetota bacterium]|nr:hypothetical protein [Actinomycetota bacterium]
MDNEEVRPAFYAARQGTVSDWWTLLHPPYTAWHLSYVLIGAGLAPHIDLRRLAATLVAFFLAVGISAHALDELNGRPLKTRIGDKGLWIASVVGLLGAISLGALGAIQVSVWLLAFIPAGAFLVLAYNLEWFDGLFHSDFVFAAAWGSFPVLTAAFAQKGYVTFAEALAAVAAFGLSAAQRTLSTPARSMRRQVIRFEATVTTADGSRAFSRQDLIEPLERALRILSWTVLALGLSLVTSKVMR